MKKNIIFLSFFLLLNSYIFAKEIYFYKVQNYCVEYKGEEYKVIRSFYEKKKPFVLAVNTNSLKTDIFKKGFEDKKVVCKDSKFLQLLRCSCSSSHPLVNDGIRSFKYGLYLTTDMCPSSQKGYEREFYKEVIKRFANPVPITIFVTKRWIKSHKSAFKELKRWDEEGKLAITWGNHTAYHFYKRGLPISQNFVLYRHEHLKDDVLELEKYLIENGVTPSVFFRFPGLVSNKKAVKIIEELSLVILGSDAWIAKNEMPKDGSIILVHGNKNEHIGIKKLLKYFKTIDSEELYPVESAF